MCGCFYDWWKSDFWVLVNAGSYVILGPILGAHDVSNSHVGIGLEHPLQLIEEEFPVREGVKGQLPFAYSPNQVRFRAPQGLVAPVGMRLLRPGNFKVALNEVVLESRQFVA